MDRTPLEWLELLLIELQKQRAQFGRYDAYYTGDHPLPDAPRGARAEFLRLMRLARSNWMELVVDAVAERLIVDGVRFGNQPGADLDIWSTLWQPNGLDAEHGSVHTEALIGGRAAVLVWPRPGNKAPSITPEHPTEVYVRTAPGDRRRRVAAIKAWTDGADEYAIVWLPELVHKFRRLEGRAKWEPWAEDSDPDSTFTNPLHVVPVVPFDNKRRMIGVGVSELAGGVTDIQDRINETIFNRLTAARFSAFRQRWVTGMEIPVDPETNKPVEPFKAAVDRLWMTEDKEVKFGEFTATDLAPYIKACEADIQHLAAISRTPPHYLLGQSGAFPSGESLKSTETGLVRKVSARALSFGERWEDVIRLGLSAMDDARAADDTLEIIWRDPETKGLAELVDALVKLSGLGIPNEALWEMYGASPQQIGRWRAQAARAKLTTAAVARPAELPAAPAPELPPAPADARLGLVPAPVEGVGHG